MKRSNRRIAALTTLGASLGLAASLALAQQANWHPSKWGAKDEIGAANYLTPERAAAAAKLVKTGKVYSLGIEVTPDTPAFPPRGCKLYIVQPGQHAGATLGETKTSYNDDILNCWVGIGSQLDGLGHIGIDTVSYNGVHAKDFVDPPGLKKYGIEKVPPMVTRGVLLDMAGYLGVDVVKEGTPFNKAEIEGADKAAYLARWAELNDVVHRIVASLGGSISAEHGIGRLKRAALARYKGHVDLQVMHAIKRVLDPKGILNPGKLLPDADTGHT